MPSGYSPLQIRLHWVIFALVVLQFIFNQPMSDAWDDFEDGLQPEVTAGVIGHVVAGLLVLALALWRIAVRLRLGVPPLPDNEAPVLKVAAHATHWALYLLIVVMPVSGAVAWFRGVEGAADAHETLKVILLFLVGLHILAALYHHFVLKTDILRRMLRAR